MWSHRKCSKKSEIQNIHCIICCHPLKQGRIQRGRGARGHAPNRRLSRFFNGKSRLCWDCSLHQKCSVDLKYAKNALAAGAPPGPHWGSSRCSPRPLVGWGGGHPLPNPHPSRRLRRLNSAQLRCPPPNVKSWLRPCVNVCNSQMVLWHTCKYQLALSKTSHNGWDFIPHSISKNFRLFTVHHTYCYC